MSPTIVADPSFLVHQTVRARAQKPIISHRNGNPEIWKKIGEMVELRTPHKLAESDITAMSWVFKYGTVFPFLQVIL